MKRQHISLLILVLSIVLIATGLLLHQNQEVFAKAAKICMECVGIG